MTPGVAAAGAAAAALQLLRAATFMAALMGARLTVVAVGSAPAVASEVVVVMLAGPRDIGVDAVKLLVHVRRNSILKVHSFPFADFTNFPQTLTAALRDDLMTDTT